MKQVELTPDLTLDAILQQMNGEDVLVTQHGRAVALLSACDDDELYWYKREHEPAFIASIAEAREQAGQGRTITQEDLKKHLGIE